MTKTKAERGVKRSTYYQLDVFQAVDAVAKSEGFNFAQAVNWLLRKALRSEKDQGQP